MYSTRIKSIKKVGVVDTYDISTPKYHNFFLDNGILSHNCAVVGSTGSGKSWSCLSMAEEYSKMFDIPFNPEYHVISSLKELLLLITAPEADKKVQYGSVIVFDEPQVEGNARNWQSEMNQALSQLISTFRNQRLVVFFATPFLEMIDKQSRTLFHGEFKILGFDRNTGITNIKPRFLEYYKKIDDFYRKRLIVEYKRPDKVIMGTYKLGLWKINKPSKEVIDVYEGKKKKFTDDLNKKLLAQIEMSEKQTKGKNHAEELRLISDLLDEWGTDYVKILDKVPHLTPLSLEKYINFIKRSREAQKVREADKKDTE